jgi:hypothetical protein
VNTRRCTYCHERVGVVLLVFDGVSEQPVSACRDCRDRLGLQVFKVEVLDAAALPAHPTCEDCGCALPSPDTEPVVVWVGDRRRGIVATCNACRVKSSRPTLLVTVPEEQGQPDGTWE